MHLRAMCGAPHGAASCHIQPRYRARSTGRLTREPRSRRSAECHSDASVRYGQQGYAAGCNRGYPMAQHICGTRLHALESCKVLTLKLRAPLPASVLPAHAGPTHCIIITSCLPADAANGQGGTPQHQQTADLLYQGRAALWASAMAAGSVVMCPHPCRCPSQL